MRMNRLSSTPREAIWPLRDAPLSLLALLAASIYAPVSAAAAREDFKALAEQCAPSVHVTTLSAIVRHESSVNPYAIGVNADGYRLPRQPRSKTEAIEVATWLQEHGYNFDGGYGQVNVKNLAWLGMTVADLFEPCKNLQGAARVLGHCYARASKRYGEGQQALRHALSCYNTGNFEAGFANGYVLKVAANATLAVPALMPLEGAPQPIKLEAAQRQTTPPARQALPDGLGDAFSRAQGDAFSVPSKATAEPLNVVEEKR